MRAPSLDTNSIIITSKRVYLRMSVQYIWDKYLWRFWQLVVHAARLAALRVRTQSRKPMVHGTSWDSWCCVPWAWVPPWFLNNFLRDSHGRQIKLQIWTPWKLCLHGKLSHGNAMGTLLAVLVGFELGTPAYISVSILTRLTNYSYTLCPWTGS